MGLRGRVPEPIILKQSLKRAVKLKPSYAQAQHWLGLQLLYIGRLNEAKTHISRAVELNPQHRAASMTLVEIYLAEGEAQQALSRVHQDMRRMGIRPRDLLYEAIALFHLGRFEEARSISKEVAQKAGGGRFSFFARLQLAMIDATVGNTNRAEKRLDKIEKKLKGQDWPRHFARGMVYAALNNEDLAFSALQKIPIGGWGATIFRYWYPAVLGPLREDSRYERLIEKINRSYGLNSDGSVPYEADTSAGSFTDA